MTAPVEVDSPRVLPPHAGLRAESEVVATGDRDERAVRVSRNGCGGDNGESPDTGDDATQHPDRDLRPDPCFEVAGCVGGDPPLPRCDHRESGSDGRAGDVYASLIRRRLW
jgi:hypothetical protein